MRYNLKKKLNLEENMKFKQKLSIGTEVSVKV